MDQPYYIPNGDRNVRLVEKKTGLLMIYTLACPSNFNDISFRSNGKCYFRHGLFIPYQNDMGVAIEKAYIRLKNRTMLILATFKRQQLDIKIAGLVHNNVIINMQ